jgi:hypothetical protein
MNDYSLEVLGMDREGISGTWRLASAEHLAATKILARAKFWFLKSG